MNLMDREEREDNWQMRDSEVALLDITKMLLEVLIASGTVQQGIIEQMMMEMKAKYAQRQMPDARTVVDLLSQFLNDERRQEFRQRLGIALQKSPKAQG